MKKIPMTQEDRDYFKSGVRTLCGIEVIQAKNIINDPGLKVVFTSIYFRGFGLYEQRTWQTGRGGICPNP